MNKPLIYLVSKSPRRQMLMKQVDIKCRVLVPSINEQIAEKNPARLVIKLARDKVWSVQNKIKYGILIGVDTLVVTHEEILGKPGNEKQAYQMMQRLSGNTHQVISGLYLLSIPDHNYFQAIEKTLVRFRRLREKEIRAYIKTDEPYDKAGGYGIQCKAGSFVESIDGCYYNVVGLPIAKLIKGLRKLSVKI
jgi:septum formation protein